MKYLPQSKLITKTRKYENTKTPDRIYRIYRMFSAFPEERQKSSSLFEGGATSHAEKVVAFFHRRWIILHHFHQESYENKK